MELRFHRIQGRLAQILRAHQVEYSVPAPNARNVKMSADVDWLKLAARTPGIESPLPCPTFYPKKITF